VVAANRACFDGNICALPACAQPVNKPQTFVVGGKWYYYLVDMVARILEAGCP
jgi:hypothetical protein